MRVLFLDLLSSTCRHTLSRYSLLTLPQWCTTFIDRRATWRDLKVTAGQTSVKCYDNTQQTQYNAYFAKSINQA